MRAAQQVLRAPAAASLAPNIQYHAVLSLSILYVWYGPRWCRSDAAAAAPPRSADGFTSAQKTLRCRVPRAGPMVTTASQAPIAATTVVEHTPCSLPAARGAGAERARTLERRSERPARPSGPSGYLGKKRLRNGWIKISLRDEQRLTKSGS